VRKILFSAALVTLATACSSATATSGGGSNARNTITAAEIQAVRAPGWFAWDLIAAVRPHFLRSQSAQTLTEREPVFAVVYVDDIYHGELDSLKTLRLEKIHSIQFLSAFDARTRFGTDMPGGAILIRTL